MTVGTSVIQPKDVAHVLGVILDSELSMNQRMTKMTSTCFYQLQRACTASTSTRWAGTYRLTGSCIRPVTTWLWQLGSSGSSEIYHRATTSCSECRSPTSIWPENGWTHDTRISETPLASSTVCGIQTVHDDALHPDRTVSDVPRRYSSGRRWQSNTTRSAFGRDCAVPET
jgi:hypothetical protein